MPDHVTVVTRQLRIHPGEAIRKSSDRPAPAYEGRNGAAHSRREPKRFDAPIGRSISSGPSLSASECSSKCQTDRATALPQRSIGAPRYGGPTARRKSSSRDAQKSEA
jgi:hypothetical protein